MKTTFTKSEIARLSSDLAENRGLHIGVRPEICDDKFNGAYTMWVNGAFVEGGSITELLNKLARQVDAILWQLEQGSEL